jgi:hypothetical protein
MIFFSFLSYIIVMPLMIGFSKKNKYYFHLGSIWNCLLPSFVFECYFKMILKMVHLNCIVQATIVCKKYYFLNW